MKNILKGLIVLFWISHTFGDEVANIEIQQGLTNNELNLNHEQHDKNNENIVDHNQDNNLNHISTDTQSINIKDNDEPDSNIVDSELPETSENVENNIADNELNIEHNDDSEIKENDSTLGTSLRNENLSLKEILKRLMQPHHLQSYEDSDINYEAKSSKEDGRDEDLPNSGSGMSSNSPFINSTEVSNLNITAINATKNSNSSHTKKATCLEIEELNDIEDVEIVNSTTLQKILKSNATITSRSTPAECFLIYFYSPYCPFSAQGSAYVNALARSLPNIPIYGLNSIEYHSLNARYGIMGTPSLVLFHNGHTVGRYNASEYSTYNLEAFIHHFTNQKTLPINVTSLDFKAYLPSQALKSSPFGLYIAWAFLLICGGYVFLNSEFYAKLTEAILNNWREAEAQHEHDE